MSLPLQTQGAERMLGFPASGRGQGCVEPRVHCVHPDSGSCYKFLMGPRTHSSSEGRLHMHWFLATSTAGHISRQLDSTFCMRSRTSFGPKDTIISATGGPCGCPLRATRRSFITLLCLVPGRPSDSFFSSAFSTS